MDQLSLPQHVVENVERRWAQKLEQQVAAWKKSPGDTRGVTSTGVPVIRRAKRARLPQQPNVAA